MAETIFSKIIQKQIPAKIVFENERVLAFHDVNPQAPTHILIIPKKEISNAASATEEDAALLGELILIAADIAKKERIEDGGYRLVINCGENAGQTVPHIHLHLLGGRPLDWPPG